MSTYSIARPCLVGGPDCDPGSGNRKRAYQVSGSLWRCDNISIDTAAVSENRGRGGVTGQRGPDRGPALGDTQGATWLSLAVIRPMRWTLTAEHDLGGR